MVTYTVVHAHIVTSLCLIQPVGFVTAIGTSLLIYELRCCPPFTLRQFKRTSLRDATAGLDPRGVAASTGFVHGILTWQVLD